MITVEETALPALNEQPLPPPVRENRCCRRVLIYTDGGWVHLVDRTPCVARLTHRLNVLCSDAIGTIATCSCGRWGIATETAERAEWSFVHQHLAEMGVTVPAQVERVGG
jgi:hypothetical protein